MAGAACAPRICPWPTCGQAASTPVIPTPTVLVGAGILTLPPTLSSPSTGSCTARSDTDSTLPGLSTEADTEGRFIDRSIDRGRPLCAECSVAALLLSCSKVSSEVDLHPADSAALAEAHVIVKSHGNLITCNGNYEWRW